MNYYNKVRTSVPNTNPTTPEDERRQRLRRQARFWVHYARCHSGLSDAYLKRKAQESLRFCIEGGAKSFGIPSKLRGTRDRQAALATVHETGLIRGHPLEAHLHGERVVVAVSGMVLGEIGRKHRWLVPLMEYEPSFWLLQVTGTDSNRKFFGLNLAVCVGKALEQRHDAWMRALFPPPALVRIAD